MSDELKNGDRVVREDRDVTVTGTYIGPSGDPYYPNVVRVGSRYDAYRPGIWKHVPDEVTITIPREVALNYATTAFAADDHFAMRDICREALPDWDDES